MKQFAELAKLNSEEERVFALCEITTSEQLCRLGVDGVLAKIEAFRASGKTDPEIDSWDQSKVEEIFLRFSREDLVDENLLKNKSLAWKVEGNIPEEIQRSLPLAAMSVLGGEKTESEQAGDVHYSVPDSASSRQWKSNARMKAQIVVHDIGAEMGPKLRETSKLRSETAQLRPEGSSVEDQKEVVFQNLTEALANAPVHQRMPEKPFWQRQGITHVTPFRSRIGAFVLLLTALSSGVAMGSLAWVLWSKYQGAEVEWIYLIPVGVMFLMGFFYLTMVWSARCSVCKQPIFFPKRCRRNRRAHHIIGLGNMIPTALMVLIFGWFRCPYCGTAQRLDEREGSIRGKAKKK